jgi:hypothetical protein
MQNTTERKDVYSRITAQIVEYRFTTPRNLPEKQSESC